MDWKKGIQTLTSIATKDDTENNVKDLRNKAICIAYASWMMIVIVVMCICVPLYGKELFMIPLFLAGISSMGIPVLFFLMFKRMVNAVPFLVSLICWVLTVAILATLFAKSQF